MTELHGTFDTSDAYGWEKLFGETSLDDIDVIVLHDKKTGKEREFVPIEQVLEIINEEQEEYRTAYEALANVYNRVMALKGDTQWQA